MSLFCSIRTLIFLCCDGIKFFLHTCILCFSYSKSAEKKRKHTPSNLPDGSGLGDHIQFLQIFELWHQTDYNTDWCKENNLQVLALRYTNANYFKFAFLTIWRDSLIIVGKLFEIVNPISLVYPFATSLALCHRFIWFILHLGTHIRLLQLQSWYRLVSGTMLEDSSNQRHVSVIEWRMKSITAFSFSLYKPFWPIQLDFLLLVSHEREHLHPHPEPYYPEYMKNPPEPNCPEYRKLSLNYLIDKHLWNPL